MNNRNNINIGRTIFNDIYTRFIDKLNRISNTTNINCNIDINEIRTRNINNCNIVLSNKCVSNEITSFTLLLQSLGEVMLLLPEDRRTQIENILGLKTEDIINENDIGFIHDCTTNAIVDNNINIATIEINNCYSRFPTDFLFLNAGSADSNCGIKYISDALLKLDERQPELSLQLLFNIKMFDYIVILITIILIYILFIFLSFLLPRNNKTIYYSRNTILNKNDKILENIHLRHYDGIDRLL
ncbi:S-S bond formation pathway protein substrate (Cop-F9L) [Choristoneura biennis entomopoxvirus]|uniref:S-S bond formation pathway protein substrate (Cop-F9L) n=1 Tax=Choristoneura biennis entomopoxvirus TaxID=10288 RepID=A0A916KPT0_CBEPV|nr:S-S bond formation pathway protein substrate (Cop-F9L) [Choristoneura biennis entomopoxvirus]CCU55847.1 S-S bond formation pathway protein substrate (Cop-F9L) [Choristoneura biennis entomopoxvirus]